MAIGVGSNYLNTPDIGAGYRSRLGDSLQSAASGMGTGGGGFDIKGLLNALGPILGALGVFSTVPSTKLDFQPSLTPDTARSLTQSAGQRAFSTIGRQAGLAKTNVGSQYYARGLGRSGAAIGDIAGINMQAAGAMADIQPQLAAQLAQLLAGIDQRGLQQAMYESQSKQSQWGDLADFGALLGQALPFIIGGVL